MRVQVRLHVMPSARCVQLLVKLSVVVSMSMNQSSSCEESCPSNLGISCSRVTLMFACIVVCMGSSLGWVFGHGQSTTARCCGPPANCDNSSICVGGWLAGLKGGQVSPKVAGTDLATQPSDS